MGLWSLAPEAMGGFIAGHDETWIHNTVRGNWFWCFSRAPNLPLLSA